MTAERIDGPTPGGGEYAIVVYTDQDLNEVDKDAATVAVTTEYDGDDVFITESVLTLHAV